MFVTDQEMQNVALHVRRLRKIHKLTQKQMAKMLAISPDSLSKIEKGILPQKHRVLVPFSNFQHIWSAGANAFLAKAHGRIEKSPPVTGGDFYS